MNDLLRAEVEITTSTGTHRYRVEPVELMLSAIGPRPELQLALGGTAVELSRAKLEAGLRADGAWSDYGWESTSGRAWPELIVEEVDADQDIPISIAGVYRTYISVADAKTLARVLQMLIAGEDE